MSLVFSGSTNSHISRTAGNPASTGSFTHFMWVKRTGAFPSTLKWLGSIAPTPENTGHDLVINDPGFGTDHYKATLQANWATTQAGPTDTFLLDTWTCIAIVGSGANISLKYWDVVVQVWDTYTVAQTAFIPTVVRWGGSGFGNGFTGQIAHLRTWNGALTDAELSAERVSTVVVRVSGLLSDHPTTGDLSAALIGRSGTAYTNGGGVTYSSDNPAFDSFSGPIISGDGNMPYEAVAAGTRYNYILYSGNLSNAVWTKQGNSLVTGAVAAPANAGTSQRIRQDVTTGGIYQLMTSLPAGRCVAVMAVKRVDTDYVVLKHQSESFGSGIRGLFNLVTGVWATWAGFGGLTDSSPTAVRSLGNGWWLIGIAGTIVGNRILEFFPVSDTQQIPAVGRQLDVCAFQYELAPSSGTPKLTFHKPTTTAVVSRTLSSLSMNLSSWTISMGSTATATAELKDNIGAPWDQFSPVQFSSSDPSKAALGTQTMTETDFSGRITRPVDGVASGTSTITATAGTLSGSAVLTVGTTVNAGWRWARITAEPGWQGTSGWDVGIYRKHAVERFPTERLHQASAQTFLNFSGPSVIDVLMPFESPVVVGQVVEAVLENDNVNGGPADGPGIFSAVIIGANPPANTTTEPMTMNGEAMTFNGEPMEFSV